MTTLEIHLDWDLVPGTVRKNILCEKVASGDAVTITWLDKGGKVLRQDVQFMAKQPLPIGAKGGLKRAA